MLRASTLVDTNLSSILHQKSYFFLFYTSIFTKHSHQFIYFTHLFNKIFILLQFFIIPFLTAPLSLRPTTTNDHSTPNHHHHHPISIIKENQPTKQETQDRHGKPQRKTLKNQTKITEPRREREGERERKLHCETQTNAAIASPQQTNAANNQI